MNDQVQQPQAHSDSTASLVKRARSGDPQAMTTMFRQFIPPEEEIVALEFLGTEGLWGIGARSFGCVTDRRVATLRVKAFGEVEYQDGLLEYVNSGVVYQPSRLGLYVFVIFLSLITVGLALLLLPFTVRLFYRFKKSGLVLWIREGLSVYMFADRSLLPRANALHRAVLKAQEARLGVVGTYGSVY